MGHWTWIREHVGLNVYMCVFVAVGIKRSCPFSRQFFEEAASAGLKRSRLKQRRSRRRMLSASAETNPLLSPSDRWGPAERQPSKRLTHKHTLSVTHKRHSHWFSSLRVCACVYVCVCVHACVTQFGVSKAEDAAICSIHHWLNHLCNCSCTHLRLATESWERSRSRVKI